MATGASDHEQQRRELEEIRRQFAEVGKRIGSAFEPAPSDDDRQRPVALAPSTAPPDEQPARPRWQWVAVVALIFLLGIGFGYALPRAATGDPPPSPPPATRSPVTTLALKAPPVTRYVAPPACLETARRGDEVFALLSSNVHVNDRRLAEALKAYTLASQACRQAASP